MTWRRFQVLLRGLEALAVLAHDAPTSSNARPLEGAAARAAFDAF